ncbi:MAG: flagellar hook-basal body complex protein [Burkholderiaceae bacterium]|jgi:flagellar hook protein FlgE
MSNFGIGISGLRANSTAIDVISTNIANAATVGYKAGEFMFQDQFFKALNPMDPARAGQGTLQQNIRRLFNMGSVQDSANTLDMAITGASGMFQLASSTNPKEIFYSRNGQFAVSAEQSPAGQNYIVNENGMYLTGYTSTDGVTIDDGDSLNKITMPPTELSPVTTTESEISVTLDARTNAFLTSGGVAFNPLVPSTYHHKVSQTVFSREDNGGEHSLTLYYRRVQDKELEITYDVDSTRFSYPPSEVAHQNSSTDVAKVFLTEDTSAGIKFLTGANLGTNLSEAFVGDAEGGSLQDFYVDSVSGISAYARVVVNGRDTGVVVTEIDDSDADAPFVTLSGVPTNSYEAGDKVEFFNVGAVQESEPTDFDETTGLLEFAVDDDLNMDIQVGQYVWAFDGTDYSNTGARIISIDRTNNTLTLDPPPDDGTVLTGAEALYFYNPVSYTMTAQDGSQMVMKGDLFDNTRSQTFNATTTQYEVYGQLDNQYFNNIDQNFNSGNPSNLDPTIDSEYNPVAIMSFWGGKNIDNLVYDGESGDPAFSSKVTLNAQISTSGTADPINQHALTFDLDLTKTRNYATPFSVDLAKQDGSSVAMINSVSIDKEGRVIGSYGDGRQYISGQLALVQFNAVNDLVAVGGNVFMAKAQENPGIEGYIVGKPGSKGLGEIRASAVEASNVDLTNELVKLMQMQRMYSANSQSVRAYDDTLQATIRMTGG